MKPTTKSDSRVVTGTRSLNSSLIESLPLPLAQLYEAATFAKSPLQGFLDSFHLWEAGLRLMTISAVLEYQARRPANCPLPESLSRALHNLARPSLGHWRGLIRELLPAIVELGGSSEDHYASLGRLMSSTLPAEEWPGLARLQNLFQDRLVRSSKSGPIEPTERVNLRECFDLMVTLRNRMIGHAAIGRRDEAFYEDLWDTVLGGVEELLLRVDVLVGCRLVYVARVGLVGGVVEYEWSELAGLAPGELRKNDAPKREADHLEGERVYILAPGKVAPKLFRPAHPYLYFQEARRVFWMLAQVADEKEVELLSYTTGEAERLSGISEQSTSLNDSHRRQFAEDFRTFYSRLFGEESAMPSGDSVEAPPGGPRSPAEVGRPERFIDDFETMSEIHRTTHSVVYRAVQRSLHREVVLKVHSAVGNEESEIRFHREIQASAQVCHPHLARVYTSGLHRGRQFYYAMESVRGAPLDVLWDQIAARDLDQYLPPLAWGEIFELAAEAAEAKEILLVRPEPPTVEGAPIAASALPSKIGTAETPAAASSGDDFQRIAELAYQIAEAADALHGNKIIHRDIKPSNVILTSGGSRAVLVDLGSVKNLDASPLTEARAFIGTPRYASPEQVTDSRFVDVRTDVYAIGIILWEFLTLQPAFSGDPDQIGQQVVTRLLPVPHSLKPSVPLDLEAITLKCVQKDPGERYGTARELVEDLGRYLRGEEVMAHRATLSFQIRRWCRHNRKTLQIVGVAAMLVGIVFSGLIASLIYQNGQIRKIEEVSRKEAAIRAQEYNLQRHVIVRKVEAISRVKPRLDLTPPHPVELVTGAIPTVNNSAFKILEDNRVVDLRSWANDAHGAVTMTRRVRVFKEKEADEYVIEGRTSATDLIHRCIRPNPQTARLLHLHQEGDMGSQKMKIRRICIDVRDIPVNIDFEVEVVSTFIGSLLNPEERVVS
jgi:serine/threonine protein kinase